MTDGIDGDTENGRDDDAESDRRGFDGDDPEIDRAAAAIDRRELVVYPTETVYGLAANALDPGAVKRVFSLKGRSPDEPISLAVARVEEVGEYARPTGKEKRFMNAFLPGPVTVLVEARPIVPDALTAGHSEVGIRVPDHDLAREVCRRCGPLTATSANRSGGPNAREVSELDSHVREGVSVVLDGGRTSGTESTVVDIGEKRIVRRGASVEAIEAWLAER